MVWVLRRSKKLRFVQLHEVILSQTCPTKFRVAWSGMKIQKQNPLLWNEISLWFPLRREGINSLPNWKKCRIRVSFSTWFLSDFPDILYVQSPHPLILNHTKVGKGHRVSTHLERKRGGGRMMLLLSNEPYWPLPYNTVPIVQYYCLGMPGRQAGSTVSVYARVQCRESKTGQ